MKNINVSAFRITVSPTTTCISTKWNVKFTAPYPISGIADFYHNYVAALPLQFKIHFDLACKKLLLTNPLLSLTNFIVYAKMIVGK